MVEITTGKTIILIFSVILVVGGIGIGFWNYQSTQACNEEYPPGPNTQADCEDALTLFLQFGSLLSISAGFVIIGWTSYKDRIQET